MCKMQPLGKQQQRVCQTEPDWWLSSLANILEVAYISLERVHPPDNPPSGAPSRPANQPLFPHLPLLFLHLLFPMAPSSLPHPFPRAPHWVALPPSLPLYSSIILCFISLLTVACWAVTADMKARRPATHPPPRQRRERPKSRRQGGEEVPHWGDEGGGV